MVCWLLMWTIPLLVFSLVQRCRRRILTISSHHLHVGCDRCSEGVAVTHENVTRLFDSLEVGFPLGLGQVWSQVHSYAFDFSVWEMWGALLHGGRLVVVPDVVARSPEDFHALLVAEQVSVLTQRRRRWGCVA